MRVHKSSEVGGNRRSATSAALVFSRSICRTRLRHQKNSFHVVHVKNYFHFSLSYVHLLFTRIKTQKRGDAEFRIRTTNNPAQHVHPCNSAVVIRPTVQSTQVVTQPPPCVMTTVVWNGTVGPNFGHSGIQESLLTQLHGKPRLITGVTKR
jgi:hypothetical protein